MSRRCADCRKRARTYSDALPGRALLYRRHLLIVAPKGLKANPCPRCGFPVVDADGLRCLESEYYARLTREARRAMRRIGRHSPFTELERIIGVSSGYTSRIRTYPKPRPSAQLVLLLCLLSDDPRTLLRKIEAHFAGPEVKRD